MTDTDRITLKLEPGIGRLLRLAAMGSLESYSRYVSRLVREDVAARRDRAAIRAMMEVANEDDG